MHHTTITHSVANERLGQNSLLAILFTRLLTFLESCSPKNPFFPQQTQWSLAMLMQVLSLLFFKPWSGCSLFLLSFLMSSTLLPDHHSLSGTMVTFTFYYSFVKYLLNNYYVPVFTFTDRNTADKKWEVVKRYKLLAINQ